MATEEKRAPVKYTVLEKSLVGNEIFEEGAVVEYDGLPAENLAPMCDEGRARYQEYLDSNAERVRKMKADYGDQAGIAGDPEAFAKAVRAAIAEANAQQADLISKAVASAIAQVFPNGTAKKAVDPAADKPADAPIA
jgi:hypothetical protein